MRILAVSEGASELNGALQTLVRRLLGIRVEIDARNVRDQRGRLHLRPGRGEGLTRLAIAGMNFALREEYDAIAFVIDRDRDKRRQAQLDRAQSDVRLDILRAIGLAVEMFDAWMLSDESALTAVLGVQVDAQSAPESLPRPKDRIGKLLAGATEPRRPSDVYALIAEKVDLDLLKRRCPTGFAPFAKRVEAWRS